jgi:hypothetical protein
MKNFIYKIIDIFQNSLCLKKFEFFERIYCQILRAYVWSKNLAIKMPEKSISASKWSFERCLLALSIYGGSTLLMSSAYSQQTSPQNPSYSGGQAVFVHSPYGSSVYTDYTYDPNRSVGNRLPPFTTNQAVFVQQPYSDATQKVTTYPTTGQYSLPYTESGYSNPTAYPGTTSPAYPFATVRSYTSSPYSTVTQYADYNYPNTGYPNASNSYSSATMTSPYTTTRQLPTSYIQNTNPNAYPTSVYSTYPTSVYQATTPSKGTTFSNYSAYPNAPSAYQSPYPLSTALPESNLQQPKTSSSQEGYFQNR